MERWHRIAVVATLLGLLLTLPSWSLRHPTRARAESMAADVQRLRHEAEELRARNRQLLREVRSLTSDSRSVELRAREELFYVRPDEIVLLFPETDSPGSTLPETESHERP